MSSSDDSGGDEITDFEQAELTIAAWKKGRSAATRGQNTGMSFESVQVAQEIGAELAKEEMKRAGTPHKFAAPLKAGQISKRVLEEKEDKKMAKMQKKVFSEAKKQYTKVTEDGVEKMVAKSVQSAKKVQKKMAKEHLDKENRNHDLAKRFEAAKNHEVPSYMKTTDASAHKGFKVPKTSPKTKTGASKRK
mmetsp:Transcript_51896/g.75946  ORF Transcript_51896/g.75946 Transcript_51896/m.75946 type:complete len:191 (-) Transcript_51896:213-785(-)